MSFDSVPSKSEVLSWNANRLADYLRRLELAGCDKVVLKCSMTGSRFLNMSDNDLQKFPKIHAPMISKVCHQINRKEEKKGLFHKSKTQRHVQEDFVEDDGWDQDEFDEDDCDDHDYESPVEIEDNDSDGDYESPIEEGSEAPEEDIECEYEAPPCEFSDNAAHRIFPTKPLSDGDYIDAIRNREDVPVNPSEGMAPTPPHRPGSGLPQLQFSCPNVPQSSFPGCELPSQRPLRPSAKSSPSFSAPQVDRSKKPSNLKVPAAGGKQGAGDRSPKTSRRSFGQDHRDNVRAPQLPQTSRNLPSHPGLGGQDSRLPPSVGKNKNQKAERGKTTPHSQRPPMAPCPKPKNEQDLDPRWYVGQVTREQADDHLRHVGQDGAFLVRDSSKGSTSQPYTLMVLYQEKVYNIQIRYHADQNIFSLGTGLKGNESYSGVTEIVQHHTRTPLLLIDAKDLGNGPQKQCALTYPAGC
ncbi:hypothetical protein AGOR_G00072020 [Albula goreensis]|uniref:Lymphocyte cytosolic protein 2 n=1 Tax=Albula goreensis TaxID=1534307 RepID=A0A8T3DSP7_9TELE|nr:hypothetical protein AGOR_G00072020 [Albula goreensis]